MIVSVVLVEEVSVCSVFREKEENRYAFARRAFCNDLTIFSETLLFFSETAR